MQQVLFQASLTGATPSTPFDDGGKTFFGTYPSSL